MSQKILINVKTGFGQYTAKIVENNFVVYNEPRPLPGALTWVGDFRHGVFYAAGQLSNFEKDWLNLDAWEVQLISNDQIYELLRERAQSLGKDLDAFLANFKGGIKRLAESYNLPWED
jgi:hypothetical protein